MLSPASKLTAGSSARRRDITDKEEPVNRFVWDWFCKAVQFAIIIHR